MEGRTANHQEASLDRRRGRRINRKQVGGAEHQEASPERRRENTLRANQEYPSGKPALPQSAEKTAKHQLGALGAEEQLQANQQQARGGTPGDPASS